MRCASAWAGLLSVALILGVPGCFPSCEKPKPPLPARSQASAQTPTTPVPRAQSPATPVPQPATQSPTTPVPTPAPAPPPPPPEFSLERIGQIKEGMSYDQVLQLVGSPSVALSSQGGGALLYKWSQNGANLLCKFEDGKLSRKTVLGGMDSAEAKEHTEITPGLYQGITEGMTLDEVMALLELEGKVVSGDPRNVALYRWTDENGSSFITRFEDGKLVKKSGLYVSKAKRSADEAPAAEEAASESMPPAAEEAPQEERASTTESCKPDVSNLK